jgi:thiamine biosynthesis lipoprotein
MSVELSPVAGAGRWVIRAMDTVFSLAIPGHSDGSLVMKIAAEWNQIEEKLSVFLPDSEISRWRRGKISTPSSEFREVKQACDDLKLLTGGLFDADRDGEFDPTGYVKGWALSKAARMIQEDGIENFCVNGGGDIVAKGDGPNGMPWRIGIAHPYRLRELATMVTALPGREDRLLAVATSGTSERGSHIVNPLTGYRPVNSSITVVGEDIAVVDAVATAALAAEKSTQRELLRIFGMEAFGFDEDRHPWWTPGMTDYALLPELC